MELVSIVHVLVRRRIAVALGAVLAIAVGLSAAGALPFGPHGAAAGRPGAAESKVLVDTHSSYSNDLKGGSEVLGAQAALLATLIADEQPKASIARKAGVPAGQLDVVVSEITEPKIPSTLARSVALVVDKPRGAYAITVHAGSGVSIITLNAFAPSAAMAARLARAGTDELAAVTAARAPSTKRALVIKPLGSVRAVALAPPGQRGPLFGVAAAIALFVMWCCAIVVLAGLARAWQSAPRPVRSRGSSSAAG
jgi:hypothetical protein